MMKFTELNLGKSVLVCCNVVFMMSGVAIVALGGLLLSDVPRVLLSRLLSPAQSPTHPVFYYVALGLMATGLAVCATAVVGCWASCLQSHCVLGVYLFLLIVLLLCECSLGALVAICPEYLGVTISTSRLLDSVKHNYGLPGREQVTAAIDLAQTTLECCGVGGALDYDSSLWRLQKFGQRELIVPQSCCLLSNAQEDRAFLDPHPGNTSLCQSQDQALYQLGRHTEGCVHKLESWFHDNTSFFLAVSLGLVLVELSVLLSAILVCVKLPRYDKYVSQSNFKSA